MTIKMFHLKKEMFQKDAQEDICFLDRNNFNSCVQRILPNFPALSCSPNKIMYHLFFPHEPTSAWFQGKTLPKKSRNGQV